MVILKENKENTWIIYLLYFNFYLICFFTFYSILYKDIDAYLDIYVYVWIESACYHNEITWCWITIRMEPQSINKLTSITLHQYRWLISIEFDIKWSLNHILDANFKRTHVHTLTYVKCNNSVSFYNRNNWISMFSDYTAIEINW